MDEEKKSLSSWVSDVTDQEMPVFGHTVQSVIRTAESETSTVSQLTQIILQDSAMTARVLKMVNSVYYNPTGESISTVSRAIVLLGFETVRNICITIKLIDSLVTGFNRERLSKEMALAVHSAIQARNIAEQRGDTSPEEVFVAALLFNIGRMAFWCFGGDDAEQLDKRLRLPGVNPDQAELEVLGFTLKSLTKSLAEEWRLNDLLQQAVSRPGGDGDSARVKNVVISHHLAEISEKGWESQEAEQVINDIAEFMGQPVETVAGLLHEGAKDAVDIAGSYGAANVAKIIPVPKEFEDQVEERLQEEEAVEEQEFMEADPMLQLDILSELKELINGRPTFNSLLEMVMEGVYRGIGMDRTLFALMTPDHKELKAKYALGQGRDALTANFVFPLSRDKPNVFLYTMVKKKPLKVMRNREFALTEMIGSDVDEILGLGEFCVAPLVINQKPIGIIYADRMLSGRELDDRTMRSFEHFAAEANMGLDHITKRKS